MKNRNLALVLVAMAGCSSGTSGKSALLRLDTATTDECPTGGTAIRTGLDADRDGVLDPEEVTSTQPVCDGTDGSNGSNGSNGSDGGHAIVVLTAEPPGANCPFGGQRVDAGVDVDGDGNLDAEAITDTAYLCVSEDAAAVLSPAGFALASRYVLPNGGGAEIVAAHPAGTEIAYVGGRSVAFVDVTDAENPTEIASVSVADEVDHAGEGEPTSVAYTPNGRYAIVSVKDTNDPVAAADPGYLVFVDTATHAFAGKVAIGVGPDSIRVTRDGARVLVAIEDEENANTPAAAQARPGRLDVVTIDYATPASSTVANVATALNLGNNPSDPQPEYIDLSWDGTVGVLSLQENNVLAILDVAANPPTITRLVNAGTVTRGDADLLNDKRVSFTQAWTGRREADGVCFLPDGVHFVSANEGDTALGDFVAGQYAGGRGFTIWKTDGTVVYEDAGALERIGLRAGHYPDARSTSKAMEIEGCHVQRFGTRDLLFLTSERGSAVAVYDVGTPSQPVFLQMLASPWRPEAVTSIPARGLLVLAGEGDVTGGGIWIFRATTSSFEVGRFGTNVYVGSSAFGSGDFFGAVSGLDYSPDLGLVAVADNAIGVHALHRVELDPGTGRAEFVDAMPLVDSIGTPLSGWDFEGVSFHDAGFVLASEGVNRNGCDAAGANCTGLRNRLSFFDANGRLDASISADGIVDLPAVGETNGFDWARMTGNGFEGVAVVDTTPGVTGGLEAFVALQRPLNAPAANPSASELAEQSGALTRIGRYDVDSATWDFWFYPLEPNPPADGSGTNNIFLSEITWLGGSRFVVIERDQRQGGDATTKSLMVFDLASGTMNDVTNPVEKAVYVDLLALPFAMDFEKIEGVARTPYGLVIANDNDGGQLGTFFEVLPGLGL